MKTHALKLNKNITPRDTDFAKWYTDVIKQGELCDYGAENGSAAGTIIFRPRGYALWENIQTILNQEFRKLNVENVMLPMLISQKAFQVEKDHIEGFAPECATVTKVGDVVLPESFIIRPTSEVLFCRHFSKIISSYKQLPLIYNQWCSVIRWEKNTRPFLRTSEFLWQEGHTIHNNADEAQALTLAMIKLYAKFVEQHLAIKVIVGEKSVYERFAGAKTTYTIESMMQDGQALQAGTSHYFGQGFAKVFDIKFTNKDNKQELAYQTSWGVSTRLIGALIMSHSDDLGLVLPPTIAPTQIMILNLSPKNEMVQKVVQQVNNYLKSHFKVLVNNDDKSFSFKKSESQIKGIPLSIEIGTKEIENNQIKLVLRHNLSETLINFDDEKQVIKAINNLFVTMNQELLTKSASNLKNNLKEIITFDEYKKLVKIHKGFFIVPFCNQVICEKEVKELTSTVSRCIPLEVYKAPSNCFKCNMPYSAWTYFARAY
ncbi:proline--tRNA ligase [Spiroplasma endosymbiont of Virgichneumon dumeticola]|uniref:proline--tRNA ligase n=1 Tax=Spiroplasma endosymbiont of Virgichneumon dumeticola TaxID=3139323 RepID=UPI0035C8A753